LAFFYVLICSRRRITQQNDPAKQIIRARSIETHLCVFEQWLCRSQVAEFDAEQRQIRYFLTDSHIIGTERCLEDGKCSMKRCFGRGQPALKVKPRTHAKIQEALCYKSHGAEKKAKDTRLVRGRRTSDWHCPRDRRRQNRYCKTGSRADPREARTPESGGEKEGCDPNAALAEKRRA
jgi:hypothetical protein